MMNRRYALRTLAFASAASLWMREDVSIAQISSKNKKRAGSSSESPSPKNTNPDQTPSSTSSPSYYTLPPLPYAFNDLEPAIDAKTVQLHYEKHHAGYLAKFNQALAEVETGFIENKSQLDLPENPEEIFYTRSLFKILEKQKKGDIIVTLENQGGGYINHIIYWNGFQKSGIYEFPFAPLIQNRYRKGQEGPFLSPLAEKIKQTFGSPDALAKDLKQQALGIFGSGWVWLVAEKNGELAVVTTANQDTPLSNGQYPLFGIDVWEHAYYLKYQNKRADYIDGILKSNMISWFYVAQRYDRAAKFLAKPIEV